MLPLGTRAFTLSNVLCCFFIENEVNWLQNGFCGGWTSGQNCDGSSAWYFWLKAVANTSWLPESNVNLMVLQSFIFLQLVCHITNRKLQFLESSVFFPNPTSLPQSSKKFFKSGCIILLYCVKPCCLDQCSKTLIPTGGKISAISILNKALTKFGFSW